MASGQNHSTRNGRAPQRIATLSACMWGVEEQTRGVGITALHAMLASNSGGDGAEGFSVRSIGLRRFASIPAVISALAVGSAMRHGRRTSPGPALGGRPQ